MEMEYYEESEQARTDLARLKTRELEEETALRLQLTKQSQDFLDLSRGLKEENDRYRNELHAANEGYVQSTRNSQEFHERQVGEFESTKKELRLAQDELAAATQAPPQTSSPSSRFFTYDISDRSPRLEADIAELKATISKLEQSNADMVKQTEGQLDDVLKNFAQVKTACASLETELEEERREMRRGIRRGMNITRL